MWRFHEWPRQEATMNNANCRDLAISVPVSQSMLKSLLKEYAYIGIAIRQIHAGEHIFADPTSTVFVQ